MILTFGYGNRKDYSTFLSYLEEFNIYCVVDVRSSPRAWSRKWYGDAIEKLCVLNGIQYTSRTALGNVSGCSRWIPPVQEEADRTLGEISNILKDGSVLLLCAEMDSSRCHRVEVAQKLQDLTSVPVQHLR